MEYKIKITFDNTQSERVWTEEETDHALNERLLIEDAKTYGQSIINHEIGSFRECHKNLFDVILPTESSTTHTE